MTGKAANRKTRVAILTIVHLLVNSDSKQRLVSEKGGNHPVMGFTANVRFGSLAVVHSKFS